MTLMKKIYFSFLIFLSFLIIGLSLYYGLNTNKVVTNKNTSPLNNVENQETLSLLEKRLKDLEAENQQKINEAEQINTQDKLLSEEIRLKMGQLRDYMVQLGYLQKAIQTQEEELKKELLSVDEKKILEQKMKDLKSQHADIQTKKDQLNQATLTLIEERKALHQKKTENETTIKEQKKVFTQVTQLKDFEEEINLLTEAMNYNEAEKKQIQSLLIQNENNDEEIKKLKKYQLFLDQQLLSFDQRIKKIEREMKAFKENTPLEEKKKKKTFQDVYGMEEEKEQFANIIHYFNAKKHIIGYRNLKPMGILLYGPPGTGKSHLMEALSGEVDAHYISVDPSQFDKTYVGEGNEELEKIWAEAESHEKTIIFIDEISGLANREDKNANQTSKNIINNLLLKLDGFKRTDKKIILMGGTNHLEQIDGALRSRFQKEIKIDSFKKEETPGFLKWFMLKNNYRLSYHAVNHLESLVTRAYKHLEKINKEKTLSNRDWVKLVTEAATNYDRFAFENQNHEVMLSSDLDEALDNLLGIKKTKGEILAYRKECEDQYKEWKQGTLKYLEPNKDKTPIQKTYIFNRFNGFDQCQYKDKVPQDLAPFIREPFNNWYYTNKMPPYKGFGGSEVDYFMPSQFFIDVLSTEDSKFNNSFVNIEHTIEMEYKGPKYLLEEDKDFYVNEVKCPLQQNKRWEEGRNATYYLHFNPKKQYITLYTEKMNTKEK
ncbi:IMP dehydrogenase [Candidatus Phytoplasma ziziphi]|uniref:IMP dehydrogenase n=2 Tax=Candidatus Phytoplasma TaxID=33926 RepID=A0A660HNG5_ZIZJU|nr:ATP-binding protein [Candidatus Phytoplasma ziziphi]AYJ01502.1 IMP dehydrogenase [Candidatus Phytoplasma ziziphi]